MEINSLIQTFLWAMTPVGELRVSIPIAITVHELSPIVAYTVSVLGNILAVFLILVFLGAVSKWLSNRFYFFNRLFAWLFSRTEKHYSLKVEKYGAYILPLFVAVPLPITGGWTAALVAFVFSIPIKKSLPLITIGVLIAGGIVLFATNAGIVLQRHFGWQALLGIILTVAVVWGIYSRSKNNRRE